MDSPLYILLVTNPQPDPGPLSSVYDLLSWQRLLHFPDALEVFPHSRLSGSLFQFLIKQAKFSWTLDNTHTNPILYFAESLMSNLNPKPRHWKFLSAQVTTVLPRDLDSLPSAREAAALGEWIKSNYSFHVMRWTAFETHNMATFTFIFRPT